MSSGETTFAKEQLGTTQGKEGWILGLSWNKERDVIEIRFPSKRAPVTKRGILGKIASVYEILGVVSPMKLTGKLLYRVACDLKIAW